MRAAYFLGSCTLLAVVTGNATAGDPTGTVDFFVCTPAQLTPANTGVCAAGDGSSVTADVALVSDGVAGTFTSSATSGGVGSAVITAVVVKEQDAPRGQSSPVITADNSTPTKIVPTPAGEPQSGKAVAANAGKEQLVSKQEEPG